MTLRYMTRIKLLIDGVTGSSFYESAMLRGRRAGGWPSAGMTWPASVDPSNDGVESSSEKPV